MFLVERIALQFYDVSQCTADPPPGPKLAAGVDGLLHSSVEALEVASNRVFLYSV